VTFESIIVAYSAAVAIFITSVYRNVMGNEGRPLDPLISRIVNLTLLIVAAIMIIAIAFSLTGIYFSDTTKPYVAIVNPPNGSNIPATGTLVVSGTSSDDVAIAKVEVKTNLNDYRMASHVDANWNYWSFKGNIPTQGVNKITARATDTRGNEALYETAVYQSPLVGGVDTTPPETTFLAAYDGTGKSVPNMGNTSSNTTSISFSGFDNVAVKRYDGSLDGARYSSVSSPVSLNNLGTGSHTYRLRAIDAAGNTDQTPITFTWTVTASKPPAPAPPPATTSTWTPWKPSGYVVRISTSFDGSTVSAIDSNNNPISSSSDAATVIQAGVNAIKTKSGGGTLHINSGVYLITKTISLSGIDNLEFEGDSKETTILKCNATNVKMLSKSGSIKNTNLTIRNINIDGGNISGKLIDFVNVRNLLIDNVILERHNRPNPGVYIEDLDGALVQYSIIRNPSGHGDAFAIGGSRLTFQYNEMTRNNARGGGFTSGGLVDSKIIYNNFHDFKGYSATSLENFHIRADSVHSFKNIEIAYNTYKNLDAQAISTVGYSGSLGTFYNINIHHNRIENAIGGVRLNAMDSEVNVVTYNSRISDNTLLYTAGIAAGPINASQINNNVIDHTANWRGYGIYLYPGSDNITMNGNKITNTEKPAYYCKGSTNIYANWSPCRN
jgi:hypothetical protein